ncbi:FkbM family methyltransferase [Streptomyces sp. NE06-03E]|uniref:FkbM family methyltransferase n=1 Tax=Streptomyces sp. NE06-03E TaxID=3028695 RepID=UPI0029B03765|nr:FkbM family methyltransferase [Streptomyces sp. NE06-03E]MDX3057847.1 FkbM family methyltransferase [Streptomyces sp. NE06-03E]
MTIARLRAANFGATAARTYVRYTPFITGKEVITRKYLDSWFRDRPRKTVSRSSFGARFHTDTHDLIQRYIYTFGVWEPPLTKWLQRTLQPGDTFVDVGSNVGYYSLLASQLVGRSGSVVAIEASPDFHTLLSANVALNHASNVRTVSEAVSDRAEMLHFILASSANMGANSIVPYAGEAESQVDVPARPLPDILTPSELASVRVIKVDVEGAEGAVVRGLVPALERLRPDAELAIEVTPERLAKLGETAQELLDALAAHGFHPYRLPNDYEAASYPRAVRERGPAPLRWEGPVEGETQLVFSRTDAQRLG